MTVEEDIADRIDAALDSWLRAVKVVKTRPAASNMDRLEAQRRLMALDGLVTRYDFSGNEIIAASVEKAHQAMLTAWSEQ
ncbi:hypothetical protein N7376_22035 [Brucella intermedia GD04153]|uniref:Uncharacterized protein n=1 Tax=Brucella intermedia GD04153 TaxID=2975438 RepID=A0AA42H285_9HYPH|nr:hypothetical protein [Brucella intermedia]MDH0126659.1 hypothetical protein [Brucella intermedia GD04153]